MPVTSSSQKSGTSAFITFWLCLEIEGVAELADVTGTFFNECCDEQSDEFKLSFVEFEKGLNCGLDFEYLGQWQPPEEAATLFWLCRTGLVSCVPYRGAILFLCLEL